MQSRPTRVQATLHGLARVVGLLLGAANLATSQQPVRKDVSSALADRDTSAWCTPSPVSASRFDSVRVVAAVTPFDTAYRYSWSASAGTVAGIGPVVTWRLAGAALGVDSITARIVTRDGVPVGACTARVGITPPITAGDSARGAGDLSARAVLLPQANEDSGYARYSYVLFAARPSVQSGARYRAVLREYVRQMETTARYAAALGAERGAARQLHVTYVPLLQSIPDGTSDSAAVEQMLRAYDYARARVLLSRLPGQHMRGPYLVSGLVPLRDARASAEVHLVQDLSVVPDELVSDWLAQFLSDAAQSRPPSAWDPGRWNVRLQTAFAIVAQGIKPAAEGIAFWRDTIKAWTAVK